MENFKIKDNNQTYTLNDFLMTKDMLQHIQSLGLDMKIDTGGTYIQPYGDTKVEFTQGGPYRISSRHTTPIVIIESQSFVRTIQRVERWLNYKLFT